MLVRIWAAILIAALAWGTNGVATRSALNDGVPPIAMVAIRAVIATVVLYALLKMRGRKAPTDFATWQTGLVQGVFQLSIPFVVFTLAYENASAGFVGLLVALIPLGTAILAHFLLPDEPLHTAKVIGLSVAFAGVAFLLLSGDSGLEEGGKPMVAAGLSLLAVISISYAGVYAKAHADRFDAMELTFMQFAIGTVLIGGTMLAFEGMPGAISTWGWMLIIYMTLVGSVTPFLLFFWLLQQVSATKASLVGYVVPLISLTAGIVLLDEKLQLGIGVGGLLILVGVVLTDRSERQVVAAPPVR
ncbi:MAG: DMT family transporter [Acidimicrobiia bacterium]|nr:DMT family transporter [Acidimicrobiia bacterium]MDX2468209.1 DMT family transporter [Acidimicrobiia bacterium]